MKRPSNYKTKQREAILHYIASLEGGHVTAAQLVAHFENANMAIGRTTVYRHLEQLTESGKIRKYTVDSGAGACFQYVSHSENCQAHLHLKCEQCGKLIHLSCDMLNEIKLHFYDRHAFQVNAEKTVLYGKCESCVSLPAEDVH